MILTKITSFLLSFLFIYFTYSIIIHNPNDIGIIGYSVAEFSHIYFGYLSYITFLLLLYPIYKLNFSKHDYTSDEIIYYTLYGIFLYLVLLILQSLILKDMLYGKLGYIILEFLEPYIGISGISIFVIISLGIYLYSFLKNNQHIMISINRYIQNYKEALITFKNDAFRDTPSDTYKIEAIKYDDTTTSIKQEDFKTEDEIVINEIGDTAEITINTTNNNKAQVVNTNIDIVVEAELTEDTKDELSTVIVNELEENKKLQEDLELGKVEKPKDFILPKVDFFQKPSKITKPKNYEAIIDNKIKDLLDKLKQFKIEGDVTRTYTGPVVTTFEFKPAANVKVSKILNLQDDLSMALKATTIRIQAPIPGKDVVGIEVPNEELATIYLREILESDLFQSSTSPLTMILGKDIVGQPFITDLRRLPHLLIAGTTGSGKSVGINSMILSLLYKNSPDRLKLIMIDPKMLEFSMYNDIPHLLTPVITKATEAINALANMVKEMEKRYSMMADTRTKNIENYNEKAKKNGYDEFPYIVIIIDELADLMMTSGKEVEINIARLAQMARAAGIHLIVATQRPSVDVVTGLIKANLPSRISYKVGQKIDSKIILDAMGAESLLGKGDMLFTPPGMSSLVRVHAPWSTEDEIDKVVDFLKDQREVSYDMSFVKDINISDTTDLSNNIDNLDELYEQAKLIVLQDKKSSISYLQRRLKIGYNRAASIVEQLELSGVVSAPNAKGNREILV